METPLTLTAEPGHSAGPANLLAELSAELERFYVALSVTYAAPPARRAPHPHLRRTLPALTDR